MQHETHEWCRRIKDVERLEYLATRLAVDHLLAAVERDSTILPNNLRVRDVQRAAQRLEGTYMIRLFAEFETGLRLFWETARSTHPPTQDLLNGVAATRRIPHDVLNGAHSVREYRNTLIHEREESMAPIPIAESRKHLCRFFSFLPPQW